MKAKGIPKREVKAEYYDDDMEHLVKFNTLRKKNRKLTKKDIANNIPHFSIISANVERTYNKTQWGAFQIIGPNEFYPHGYDFEGQGLTCNSSEYLNIDDDDMMDDYLFLE